MTRLRQRERPQRCRLDSAATRRRLHADSVPRSRAGQIYAIKILNEKDVIDLNDIQDDRIVITAKACHPGRDGRHSGQRPGRLGRALRDERRRKRLKIEAANSVMRNVQYTDIQYTGSRTARIFRAARGWVGQPVRPLIFDKDSGMNNILVAHVRAVNSEGSASSCVAARRANP